MYYYILDPNKLSAEKFERLQTQLQGLLAEFKIAGETARITPLRSVADLVDTASQRGIKTLVACGSDDTFNQMLASLKGRDFTLGFIPFDEESYLSKILGIKNVFTGVKTIAARRIEKIDLARVAGNYFISFLEFGILSQDLKAASWLSKMRLLSTETKNFKLKIDNSYEININALGGLLVNTRSTSSHLATIANPTDSQLDLLLLEKLNKITVLAYQRAIASGMLEQVPKTTIIKCRKVEFLEPRGHNITMLGRVITKFPAVVEIISQRARIIVGKDRTF